MANLTGKTIAELPALGTSSDSDILPVSHSGDTYKMTTEQLVSDRSATDYTTDPSVPNSGALKAKAGVTILRNSVKKFGPMVTMSATLQFPSAGSWDTSKPFLEIIESAVLPSVNVDIIALYRNNGDYVGPLLIDYQAATIRVNGGAQSLTANSTVRFAISYCV